MADGTQATELGRCCRNCRHVEDGNNSDGIICMWNYSLPFWARLSGSQDEVAPDAGSSCPAWESGGRPMTTRL